MEFKASKLSRKYLAKRLSFVVAFIFALLIISIEIATPIYLNNHEDLNVKSEAERMGGTFYNNSGDNLYYEEYGKKENETIIFIHGLGGSTFSWDSNITLAQKYHVYVLDLLGSGMSQDYKSNDLSLDRDTEILSSFIQEKKLKNIVLVGNSTGSIVAQKLAINNPTLVDGLVLINSANSMSDISTSTLGLLNYTTDISIIKNPIAFIAMNYGINSFIEKGFYKKDAVTKVILEGYEKAFRYQGSLNSQIRFLKTSISPYDASKIYQPTLIYESLNDEIVNPSISENLSTKIKNSKLLKVDKAGHFLQQEQSQMVNDGIDKWIQDILSKQNIS